MAGAGTIFPGGVYRISRAENEALCAAVGAAPDPDGRAHPIFYYIATQAGMGLSVGALLALCDFDVADGPLMVGGSVAFLGDLRVDETYNVTGEIVSLVRKPSRAFGAVDLLTFTLSLGGAAAVPVATCTNQWVLPRRGEMAT
jgi:hypothetical protein